MLIGAQNRSGDRVGSSLVFEMHVSYFNSNYPLSAVKCPPGNEVQNSPSCLLGNFAGCFFVVY